MFIVCISDARRHLLLYSSSNRKVSLTLVCFHYFFSYNTTHHHLCPTNWNVQDGVNIYTSAMDFFFCFIFSKCQTSSEIKIKHTHPTQQTQGLKKLSGVENSNIPSVSSEYLAFGQDTRDKPSGGSARPQGGAVPTGAAGTETVRPRETARPRRCRAGPQQRSLSGKGGLDKCMELMCKGFFEPPWSFMWRPPCLLETTVRSQTDAEMRPYAVRLFTVYSSTEDLPRREPTWPNERAASSLSWKLRKTLYFNDKPMREE